MLGIGTSTINNRGLDALSNTLLEENSHLQQLYIENNQHFGDGGVTRLSPGIKQSTFIKKLVLTETNIGDEGASQLAAVLKENRSLQVLGLGKNCISSKGFISILEVLFTPGHRFFVGVLTLQPSCLQLARHLNYIVFLFISAVLIEP